MIRLRRDSLGRAEIVGSIWSDVKSAFSPAKRIAEQAVQTPLGKAAAVSLFGPQVAAAAGIMAATKAASKGGKRRQEIEKPSDADRSQIPSSSGGCVMGADAPLSDAQIMKLIRREPNHLKRERMILNLQRAQMRR